MSTGGLSGRRREELGEVALLTVGIVVTTAFVAGLLDRAWAAEGIGYSGVQAFLELFGVGIGPAVVFVTGTLAGWTALLLFDRSKRLQAPAMLLLVVVLVATLLVLGRLLIVDWTGHAPVLALGLAVGLLSGGASALPSGRREFPGAALGLYTVALLLAVFGLVDGYIVRGWFAPGETVTPVGLLVAAVTVPATVGFVVLVGYFIRYHDRREVAVVGGGAERAEGAAAAVLTGFAKHVQAEFDGDLFSGAGTTSTVPGKLVSGQRPEPLEEAVGVAYRSPQLVSRWISVAAVPVEPGALADERVATGSQGPLAYAAELLFGPYVELVRSRRGGAAATVRNADVVVFVGSMRDFLPDDDANGVRAQELTAPAYLDPMEELSDDLERGTRRVLALYDGEIAREVYRNTVGDEAAPPLTDDAIRTMLEEHVVPATFDIHTAVALDRVEGEEQLVMGAETLREEIDRE